MLVYRDKARSGNLMKKIVYLHVGRPKTGTTSVQKYLYVNRNKLQEHGFLYPETGLLDGAHHLLPVSILDNIPPAIEHLPKIDPEILYEQLLDEISQSSLDKVILSSEFFSLLHFPSEDSNRAKLAGLLSDFDVKIVVYFRYQPDFLLSSYMQEVKNLRLKHAVNFEDFKSLFLKRKPNNYRWSVARWETCFTWENIIVRAFDKTKLENGDVVLDFLEIIGSPDLVEKTRGAPGKRKKNVSPSAYRVDLMNTLAGCQQDVGTSSRLFEHIMEMPVQGCESAALCFMSREEYYDVAAMFEGANKELASMVKSGSGFFHNTEYEGRYVHYEGMASTFLQEFNNYVADKDPFLYRELMGEDRPVQKMIYEAYGYSHGYVATAFVAPASFVQYLLRKVRVLFRGQYSTLLVNALGYVKSKVKVFE